MSAAIAPVESVAAVPDEVTALAPFAEAGVLSAAALHVAAAIVRAVPGTSDEVALAAALCVRALELGSTCIEVASVARSAGAAGADAASDDGTGDDGTAEDAEAALAALAWPAPDAWAAALRSSPAVALVDAVDGTRHDDGAPGVLRPLAFDGARVHLERYWRYERQVGDALVARAADEAAAFDESSLVAVLDRFFGAEDPESPDLQRRAAASALRRRLTVLAGGPGTGKTTTVARVLASLVSLRPPGAPAPLVALAAPTGKAAARMTQAVASAVEAAIAAGDLDADSAAPLLEAPASTIHRLLGTSDGLTFRRNRANPLTHDVVVIDETSMVALPLMAHLLDALRPDARLVLVGDPFQLASIEAGAVLGDLVGPLARGHDASGPLAGSITVLTRVHRFGADSGIAALAEAIKLGDADRALAVLRDPGLADVSIVNPSDSRNLAVVRGEVVDAAAAVVAAAAAGDGVGALGHANAVKVLCGTRRGRLGSFAWSDFVAERVAGGQRRFGTGRAWYVGRPVIVTRNDYVSGVFNGDVGVTVAGESGRPLVVVDTAGGVRMLSPAQLEVVETWWAMTIHKSQGSEFGHAVVSLPAAGSRILTNELLYTGVTRGRERVTVVGTEDAVRSAIDRPVARASGLGARFWPA